GDVARLCLALRAAGPGAAPRLRLGLDGAERFPRLCGDIAAVGRLTVVVGGDLSGEKENGLSAGDLGGLRVGGGIEDAGSAVTIDLGHANLLEGYRVLGEYGDAARGRCSLR